MTVPQQKEADTRQRLLDAAAEVYSEHGFRNARVREICDRAGANIASINYHFGDKRGLYDETLRYAFFGLAGADPTNWALGPDAEPEQRLLAFVRSLLTQLLSEGKSACYAKLVAQEMFDPTPALARVIEDGIRPQVDAVVSIVREVLGPGAAEQLVLRSTGSILGQCVFYYFARSVIVKLPLEAKLDAERIDALAGHITRFSMAALNQINQEGAKKERRDE